MKQLQETLLASPFCVFYGFSLSEVDPQSQSLTLTMPFRPELERMSGTGQFHGGSISALVDVAAGFVAMMVVGSGVPTIDLRVDYLRPAINGSLTAKASVRRAGRTVLLADVEVFNDSGKLLATGRTLFSTKSG